MCYRWTLLYLSKRLKIHYANKQSIIVRELHKKDNNKIKSTEKVKYE